ncbi:hypothetical protein F5J12DRAFT_959094 [Pisolithus orientalis]|uniref:uncharacterized protein n=1 Tax=Pisolithus orientalis TaxID=936130 RepID=UPI0022259370|nr:uncharacterized protein F5J12DRAFT_959094 [Pisolithus orientalis]KAI6028281.1 hypothetical protein F5J12DRAFT_959094 [Pisolithus orientalis]
MRGTTTIYEEKQRAIEEELHDKMRRHYYEWGEWIGQVEGYNVVLFFSYSTEAMPEETAYRLAMAVRTTTTTISARATVTSVVTMTMALNVDRRPCKARLAVRWRRGMMSAGKADVHDEVRVTAVERQLRRKNVSTYSAASAMTMDRQRHRRRNASTYGPTNPTNTREYEISQSTNESLSNEMPTVRSCFVGRHTVRQLAKGNSISVLDVAQRHGDVSFGLGNVTNKQNVLDILKRLGDVYIANIGGTQSVINAAVTAGILPCLEEPFDTYNDVQEMFGPSQVISGSSSPFDYTYIENITHTHRLTGNKLVPHPSYSSATSSEPRLGLDSATTKLIESLCGALPPICAATEYHRAVHGSVQTLGPCVTPAPNAGSILSVFNTSFDLHGPERSFVHF